MEVTLHAKQEVWRGRGAPRKEIPARVAELARQTHRTGQVATVNYGPDEEAEVKELESLLDAYARSVGKRMRYQRDEGVLRFEMADRVARKATAKKAAA